MIEQIKDLPANVAGFRGSGKITKEEYDRVLIPAIKKVADSTGKINYLFILDADIRNVSAGAWYDDIKVGLSYLLRWRKMAIVSDQDTVNRLSEIAGHLLPGELRTFRIKDADAARLWVAQ